MTDMGRNPPAHIPASDVRLPTFLLQKPSGSLRPELAIAGTSASLAYCVKAGRELPSPLRPPAPSYAFQHPINRGSSPLKAHKQLPSLRSALAAHRNKHILNATLLMPPKRHNQNSGKTHADFQHRPGHSPAQSWSTGMRKPGWSSAWRNWPSRCCWSWTSSGICRCEPAAAHLKFQLASRR